ncbi:MULTISPECIES: lasso peptide biosynthesis B2 protein [unclassified Phenylobacterium]|uniref:lasso peptide biosynthesis B2 protein n=1 Tax=unclassified Phenylobacterium TaxID=2640670 RepID=UPI00083B796A|nr:MULTISPECIES: lasso peptide biosynthesis B2 protein [unclassified Phenylobacterium]
MIATETVRLAPDVHAVGVNGDLVFLNVSRDAYICLPDGEAAAHLSADRRALTVMQPDLAADLAGAGLLATLGGSEDAAVNPLAAWRHPSRSALPDRFDPPRARDAIAVAAASLDLLTAYRGRAFREILAIARRTRTAPPHENEALLACVADFHRWAPFAPTSAKCLLRSFMLLRWLQRRGHDALWVFGVRTWPFHAHCWLQCGDLVLDDEPDRIRAFTPILVQ